MNKKEIMLREIFEQYHEGFTKELIDLGYLGIETTPYSLVFRHKINKDIIDIKLLNDSTKDIIVNYINSSGKKYHISNWYLGTVNGVTTTDIFDVIKSPEYQKFTFCPEFEKSKDLSDASIIKDGTIETQQRIKDILEKVTDVLIYKNNKYGNSAIYPKRIFYKGDSINSILVRLDDKLGRIINNNGIIRVNDVVDIIGYLTLLLVAKRTDINDIEKLKD